MKDGDISECEVAEISISAMNDQSYVNQKQTNNKYHTKRKFVENFLRVLVHISSVVA